MIKEDDFDERYKPVSIPNHDEVLIDSAEALKQALKLVNTGLPDSVIDKIRFSTHLGLTEEQFNQVVNHIWTVTDDGFLGDLHAQSGFHYVNRVGYVVTETPWRVGGYVVTEKPWDIDNDDVAEFSINQEHVLDSDSDEEVDRKFNEALERENYPYIEVFFFEKGLKLEEARQYAEKHNNDELLELVNDHDESHSHSVSP
jgi:hypothetical protein